MRRSIFKFSNALIDRNNNNNHKNNNNNNKYFNNDDDNDNVGDGDGDGDEISHDKLLHKLNFYGISGKVFL